MGAELRVGAKRERGGDGRNEHQVARPHDCVGDERHPGRTVDEDQIVVVAQRPEQAPEPRERVVEIVQLQHETAQREIGRNQVEPREIAGLDRLPEPVLALEEPLGAPGKLRPDAKVEARGALRVQIPQQRSRTPSRSKMRKIDRRRGLPHPALDAEQRSGLHFRLRPSAAANPLCARFES